MDDLKIYRKWIDIKSALWMDKSIHRLSVEHFREDCEAARIQAGGGSIHISETFHNDAKSPILPLDAPVNTVKYAKVMQSTVIW